MPAAQTSVTSLAAVPQRHACPPSPEKKGDPRRGAGVGPVGSAVGAPVQQIFMQESHLPLPTAFATCCAHRSSAARFSSVQWWRW